MSFEQIEIRGRRHYVTPHGRLPSVTTVLSATKPERDRAALAAWRKREGAEEADRISKESCARGRVLHGMVEKYLETEKEGDGPWWRSVAPFVKSIDRTRPYSVERPVASKLGYAGCYDFVGFCGDLETLTDWKTSRKRKIRAWVRDYELQTAAYCGAVNELRKESGQPLINRAAVVVAYQDMPADVFVLDRDDLVKAWHEFMGRLKEYQLRYGRSA